jgi:hypothetical protein
VVIVENVEAVLICGDSYSEPVLEEKGCGCVCNDCDSRSIFGEHDDFDCSWDVVGCRSCDIVAAIQGEKILTMDGAEIDMEVLC